MLKEDSVVKYDIKMTDKMFNDYDTNCVSNSFFSKYDKVYFDSNESCDKIISKFDVKDKSILTVLGSGDQAIQFYKNGAKNVDLFDINKLTIYYYYLRIWNMKIHGSMYPENIFKNNYIKELLKSIRPSSAEEKQAYLYWFKFISSFDCDLFDLLGKFFHPSFYRKINEGIDSGLILKKISEDQFNFFNMDITIPFNLSKKYDFIYTSNIGDYIKDDRLRIYQENLYNHLNNGGIVLSSNLSGSINCSKYITQRKIMKHSFKYKKISCWNEEYMENDDIGYSYKKRRIKRII